jgi:hypothetical protein
MFSKAAREAMMKSLVTGFVLALTAIWATAASAQVYGADDDPYSQNPFASNMSLPDTSQTGGSSASQTPAPQPAQPPQDTSQTQQTAASSGGAKAPPQP